MSDDPRGHNDGDRFAGTAEDANGAIDRQIQAFLDDVGETEGFSPDDLIAALNRAIDWVHECQAEGRRMARQHVGPDRRQGE